MPLCIDRWYHSQWRMENAGCDCKSEIASWRMQVQVCSKTVLTLRLSLVPGKDLPVYNLTWKRKCQCGVTFNALFTHPSPSITQVLEQRWTTWIILKEYMKKSEKSKNIIWFVLLWLLFPYYLVLHDYSAANNQNITHWTLLAGLLHVEGKWVPAEWVAFHGFRAQITCS